MTLTLTRTGKLFDSSDRVRLDTDIVIFRPTDQKQSTASPSQCHLMIEIKHPLTDLSIFYVRDSLPRESVTPPSADQGSRIPVYFPIPQSKVTFYINYSVSSTRKSWCVTYELPSDVVRNFFEVSHRLIRRGPVGFYIQVVLKNTGPHDIHDISLKLNIPEKCGAVPVDDDRVHRIPNLCSGSRFSKVIEMAFAPGGRVIDLSYKCRWSVGELHFESVSDSIKVETSGQAPDAFPLALSLIHDHQEIVPVMEPFRVLVRVTGDADIEFTLDVKEEPNGLLPYGEHFFRGRTGRHETSFQFWLIALKQGFFKYPAFVLSANAQARCIDSGGAILVGPASDADE
jgi:hypothetical protein